MQVLERRAGCTLLGRHRLDQERDRVHAVARDAEVEPEPDHLLHLLAHHRVGDVQVGLEVVEAVEVVLPCHPVVRPRRLLHAGEDDALLRVRRPLRRPHVVVAIPRVSRARRLEPRVLRRGVVEDEVDQHAQAAVARLLDEAREVAQVAEVWMHAVVVGHVVAVVAPRRGLEREQPERRDAERGEVVEPAGEALEVADAVAVRVGERPHRELVDERVLVPACGSPGHAVAVPRRTEPLIALADPVEYA